MIVTSNEQAAITYGAIIFVLAVAIFLLRWLDLALSNWLGIERAKLDFETAQWNALAEAIRTGRECLQAEQAEESTLPPSGRDRHGRFVKGKCANPNGRRGKGAE